VGHDSPPLWRPLGVGAEVYHGHEGVRRWFGEWYDAWEYVEDSCDELIDAGKRAISVMTSRGRGRSSGAELESKGHAGVWTIRDAKVIRVVWFPTRAEALEAAGVEE
jgi:hypothetical protein